MKAALLLAACATLAATAATESTTSFAATENLSFPQDVIISSCVRRPDPDSMQQYLWPTWFPMFSLYIQSLSMFQQLLGEENTLWWPGGRKGPPAEWG
ncbi:hypothetical protein BDV40DRAFT_305453 [Aspergillus tamarii]|uniref:Uncharacterized protein n=1 Tax=Aspergillus tamarii TaxID=41984 RepID=A0A5N6UEW5_ASPTM|nr:hypothetical protein BDV40DRAFT_305453 [Aspergillus tamarii]